MSPLHAELRNILIELYIAQNHGFEKFIIQNDNFQAATLLSSTQTNTNTLPLIYAIMATSVRFQATKVLWTPHECNMVADGMSHLSSSLNYDLITFDSPSGHIQRLVHRDIAGPSYQGSFST
ncbi:hypothetical protein V6N13_001667 [Hibiscus sabdariffa]|uniref:RNase H type-1 domain-containing protein n=1 Tax=Hibiscus sabdariffa TaxID=183260 RepID=A0ABR2G8Y6_9ROSI